MKSPVAPKERLTWIKCLGCYLCNETVNFPFQKEREGIAKQDPVQALEKRSEHILFCTGHKLSLEPQIE